MKGSPSGVGTIRISCSPSSGRQKTESEELPSPLRDASFSKLRELSFSYNAGSLLRRFGLDLVNNIHVYYSIQNVWTKTDYDGPDPEINWSGADASERGQDFLTAMNPKVYTFGVTVTF